LIHHEVILTGKLLRDQMEIKELLFIDPCSLLRHSEGYKFAG